MKDDMAALYEIIATFPKNSPERVAASVLTEALAQGRLTDAECNQIIFAFVQASMRTNDALRDVLNEQKRFIDTAKKLADARSDVRNLLDRLNDPLVRPMVVISQSVDTFLDWLFCKNQSIE